jgi:hypothetical protein
MFSPKKIKSRTKNGNGQVLPVCEPLEERNFMSSFYVSPSGSDGHSGTINSPLRTIQVAINKAKSGDVINLRGGTYRISREIEVGSKGLTIQSYGKEKAKIIAPIDNERLENVIDTGIAKKVHLINLDISGGFYYAVKSSGGNHLHIINCKLHDTGRDVVKLTPGSDYSVIEKSEIYNSGRRDPLNAEGIDAVNADFAILRDCYIHNTTTNGVYYKGGSKKTLIERNKVTQTGHSGILLGQSTSEEFFSEDNPEHYENIDGIVRNNIVWNVNGAGVGAWGALRPQIYNNTLYNVAKKYFGGLLVQGEGYRASTDVTLQNNLVSVNGTRPALNIRWEGLTGTLKCDYNLYNNSGSSSLVMDEVHQVNGDLKEWKETGHDVHSFISDPRLISSSYHLSSKSPAINKGITLTNVVSDYDKQSRPSGGKTDIGADEYRIR